MGGRKGILEEHFIFGLWLTFTKRALALGKPRSIEKHESKDDCVCVCLPE